MALVGLGPAFAYSITGLAEVKEGVMKRIATWAGMGLLLAAMPTAVYSVLIANVFKLNRDLADTTFILTHIVCLGLIVLALVAWWATGWSPQ